MRVITPMAEVNRWPTRRTKALFIREQREPRDDDGIVTAFRDGDVTLRSNRRSDGFTNAVLEIGYQGVRRGDLVVHSMDGFAGAIGVSDSDGKASPVVHCYRPVTGVDARFYAYLLRDLALRGFVTSLGKGIRERSTAFDPETFRSLVVPYPTPPEQVMIADFLDRETAHIDALITAKRRMIEVLEERERSSVERTLREACPSPTPMKRFVSKIGSGSTPRGGADVYLASGVAFLRSQNIRDGRVNLDDVVHISPDVDDEMRGSRVAVGDVLLNITGGSIGRAAPVGAEVLPANVSQHVCILRPVREIDPVLLCHALHTREVQDQISLVQVGGNREGLNFEQVGRLRVRVPPPGDLPVIRKAINDVVTTTGDLRRAVAHQIDLLVEHRQALITAAVTGELSIPGVAA